ncbi:MAG: lipopolysaccharide core heptose(I) kinase RfaP, partial [Gammaproteobacteria bacterium]
VADPCFKHIKVNESRLLLRLNPRYNILLNLEKEMFANKEPKHIFFMAEKQRDYYLANYDTAAENHTTLPAWIDKNIEFRTDWRQSMREHFNLANTDLLILMVGSGFKTKGLDRALLALASLPKELLGKTYFFIIGADKPNTFYKQAKQLKIGTQVKFLGGRHDVPQLMAAADILIHPAYAESSGNVLTEALFAGLPVLATSICGFAKYITEADAGYVFSEPFSQQELNQQLLIALTDNELRLNWRQKAINYTRKMQVNEMPSIVIDKLIQLSHQKLLNLTKITLKQHNKSIKLEPNLLTCWSGKDIFSAIMQTDGIVYRAIDLRKTLKFEHNGQVYFIKQHFGVGWPEILKNLVYGRLPVIGARNEYEALIALHNLGIKVPSIAGYGESGFNPSQKWSFLITHEVASATSLEDLESRWRNQQINWKIKQYIIEKIASIATIMHKNGINHRDLYACHFLIKEPITVTSEIVLMDLHRAQIRKKTPMRWRVKDLASLYYSVLNFNLTKRDLLRFISHYSKQNWSVEIIENAALWQLVQERTKTFIKRHTRFVHESAVSMHEPRVK